MLELEEVDMGLLLVPEVGIRGQAVLVDCKLVAVDCIPEAVDCIPEAVDCTPEAVGCIPVVVDYNSQVEDVELWPVLWLLKQSTGFGEQSLLLLQDFDTCNRGNKHNSNKSQSKQRLLQTLKY